MRNVYYANMIVQKIIMVKKLIVLNVIQHNQINI